MKLTTRIERLERLACIGGPLKLTIAFFDGVLNGTISDEEFAHYAPALPVEVIDSMIEFAQAGHSQRRRSSGGSAGWRR